MAKVEYEEPSRSDGLRILVERLWPRGLSKERAAVDVWLKDIAPYQVVVVVANRDDDEVVSEAERIYRELTDLGVEVVIDDREVAAGVKFNDADLIGFPVQAVVGKRGVKAGTVDLKVRATGEKTQAPLIAATESIAVLLSGLS